MNTFIIAGHIGQDAEVKIIGNKNYVSFSIAENQKITNKETGELKEIVNWYNVLYRGDKVVNYLTKGTQVLVVGELRIDTYRSEISDTVKTSRSVFANTLQLLSSSSSSAAAATSASSALENQPHEPDITEEELHY